MASRGTNIGMNLKALMAGSAWGRSSGCPQVRSWYRLKTLCFGGLNCLSIPVQPLVRTFASRAISHPLQRFNPSTLQAALPALSQLLVLALMTAGSCWAAAPTFHTLLTNGPVANRLNVVVLSEGYTSAQLGQFLVDATNAVNTLLSWQPYQEYRNHFNAFAIAVESNQSGSDHPGYPLYRDTYFNSAYVSDYFVTIPSNQDGEGKVQALLTQFMPDCDLPLLLVNDPMPGGSGGPIIVASVASAAGPEILVHESGHTLGQLGDEYDYEVPGFTYPDIEHPNTTRETRREFIKWNAWIEPDTPIPTPPTFEYMDKVGLFEGAHYSPTGWYRPKRYCLMHDTYSPFCEVCQQALVLAIYQHVRPIDTLQPAVTNFSVTTSEPLTFNVTVLQPASNSVGVQWSTNGMPVSGATNLTFSLNPSSLGNGSHTVQATVQDHSAKVRSDPAGLLGQSMLWNLNLNLTELHLEAPALLTDGRCYFEVTGNAANDVVIEGTTNFEEWIPLQTNRLTGGAWFYTNSASPDLSLRFFRAVTRP